MYHSVIFEKTNGEKINTWDDWHLIPTKRPVIQLPSQKTNTVDIPGADGLIDLSESLSGKPIFNNREGSIEFQVLLAPEESWIEKFSNIATFIHGQWMKMILEDEPDYYYEGRFNISSEDSASDGSGTKITIDYNVNPYKVNKSGEKVL